MKRVNGPVAVYAAGRKAARMDRETPRIRWPRNATERAIWAVIANWHFAGIRQELRRAG